MRFVCIKKRAAVKAAIIATVMLLASLGVGLTRSARVWSGQSVKKLPIYAVETEENVVAISFDA
ncbi:MAG: polysaccharide deacetylase family protein, partial [Clostridiales bacterium]|nr:polysaccharide deacetylase family protein [Clostridiales bacterium]